MRKTKNKLKRKAFWITAIEKAKKQCTNLHFAVPL